MTLSALLVLCEGSPLATGGFPSQKADDVDLWRFFVVNQNKTFQIIWKKFWCNSTFCILIQIR